LSKLFAIIQREFIERVRTKAFLITTLIGPLMVVVIAQLPGWLTGRSSGGQIIAVVDATVDRASGRLLDSLSLERLDSASGGGLRYTFQTVTVSPGREGETRDSLIPLVDRRDAQGNEATDALTGILVVTDSGVLAGRVTYLGRNVGSLGEVGHLQSALRRTIARERMLRLGVSAEVAEAAMGRIELTTVKVAKGELTGGGGEAAFILSYALVLVLFVAMMPAGVQVMAAVVEEKTNRILEVLVSSVRPFDLMLGKILGVGGAVILQLAVWGASAAALAQLTGATVRPNAGAGQGAEEAARQAAFVMPPIPVDLIVITLIYFALGFLFFATAYAAVGAMCSTIQETQQAQYPVMIMIFAGYFGAFAAIGRPESTAAKVMSYLPPTAPFIVPTRWSSSSLPLAELLASIAACSLGVIGMVWLAARIYRIGILSYGKKPSFKEVWRWIRAA
jgi:ABC-2 type transport system permease protein